MPPLRDDPYYHWRDISGSLMWPLLSSLHKTECYHDSEESRKVRGTIQGQLASQWLGLELGSAGSKCRMFLLWAERTVPMQQLSNAQCGFE